MTDPRGGRLEVPSTVYSNDTESETSAFGDSSSGSPIVYVNTSLLQPPIGLSLAISKGLCMLLGLSVQLAPALSLMMDHHAYSLDVLRFLRVKGGSFVSSASEDVRGRDEEDMRGVPGYPVTLSDRQLLELKPFHTFKVGEIVAYEDGEKSNIRYGSIVSTNDHDGTADGNDEDEDEDVAWDPGAGLQRVSVCTGGRNAIRYFLSTEVYTFRSARQSSDGVRKEPPKNLSQRVFAAGGGSSTRELSSVEVSQQPIDVGPVPPAVGKEDVMLALAGLLRRAGLPLELDIKVGLITCSYVIVMWRNQNALMKSIMILLCDVMRVMGSGVEQNMTTRMLELQELANRQQQQLITER